MVDLIAGASSLGWLQLRCNTRQAETAGKNPASENNDQMGKLSNAAKIPSMTAAVRAISP